jgi:hypothetical protein
MGSVHMNPEDCAKALGQLDRAQTGKPIVVAAAHWGTFKLTDEPMNEPPQKMRDVWRAEGRNEEQLWIFRHGETRSMR